MVARAQSARSKAYAPYSNYRVGACILGSDGKTYEGCNVENASYGLSVCAERSAVVQMVLAGCREVREIAVFTLDGGSPCGMCLQTLLEFCNDESQLIVHLSGENRVVNSKSLAHFLPFGFKSDAIPNSKPK